MTSRNKALILVALVAAGVGVTVGPRRFMAIPEKGQAGQPAPSTSIDCEARPVAAAEAEAKEKFGTTNPRALAALNQALASSDPREQVRLYTRAVELDPQYVWAYYNRGNSHTELGDIDNAIRD